MFTRASLLCCMVFTMVGCELLPDDAPAKPEDKGKPDTPAQKKTDQPGATPKLDEIFGSGHAKGRTHKVEKGPFKVEISLKGVFESKDMAEVSVHTEAWAPNPLVVKQVVEHGTAVKTGDPILWLDLTKIDQMIQDLEADRFLAELAIKQAEEELPILEKSTPLDLALAERAKRLADEDLDRFLKVDRDLMKKVVEFLVKNYTNYLEYAKEELRQLEKMYRANDIREETEEIILKRQRNQIEMITFSLDRAKILREEALTVEIPRMEQTLKNNAQKQQLGFDRARAMLPLALNQKRRALEKLNYEHTKSAERLSKLKRDREAMTVRAPTDGIVYYGKCVRGKWATAGTVGMKLQRGGMLQHEEIVLTVVKPRPVAVRVVIDEKDLPHLHAGLKGKIVPTGFPERKFGGTLDQVLPVPVTAGTFDGRVSLDPTAPAEALMPGMACTFKAVPYQKAEAITVPATAVFAEELDEDRHYVLVPRKGDKPEKRPVTVGKTGGGKTEITDGLKEGDEILLEKPGAPGKATPDLPDILKSVPPVPTAPGDEP